MKIETIMEKWEEWLRDRTLLLVVSVEDENYEMSQILKDEIDKKVNELSRFIQESKLTTLDQQSVIDQLTKRTYLYMKEWYDILDVPDEKRSEGTL